MPFAPIPLIQPGSGQGFLSGTLADQIINALNSFYQWPGNFVYLDPLNGSDANNGQSPSAAYKTLPAAYAALRSGKNDVVVLIGDGGTDATARLSATFTWSKNAAHLVGIAAPTPFSPRARIAPNTTQTTNITPLITVSGSGCIFANFEIFGGVGQANTDEHLVDISGSRNYFNNVHFACMGDSVSAGRSGSYGIGLTGSENYFDNCTIGLETEPRTAANSSVAVSGAGAQRNEFRNCIFDMYPTANSPLFLSVAAGSLNGSTMGFRSCQFRTLVGAGGYTQPSVTATITTPNGSVFFDQACSTAAVKWASSGGEVAASAATGGVYGATS